MDKSSQGNIENIDNPESEEVRDKFEGETVDAGILMKPMDDIRSSTVQSSAVDSSKAAIIEKIFPIFAILKSSDPCYRIS